ncbi:hypothetical protein [Winogradskyella sp. KYW1333]|jgi:NADH:ubiquinone oxidoreductase subunit 6 (subunit J)|uniref:hypothetical protein n=1 Tax=unclassified Winogradskyella TaxID=2615021 RepID=UPI000DF43E60|nr:hypothetical protein [Winogradskyella sp. KYW1333]RCT55120.1 hypothetical protein DUZ96_05105 [Winogradskyella sp. KYW1333]
MKWFPINKNTIALLFVIIVTLGFFIAGLFEVLDYLIIKFLLICGYIGLVAVAIFFAVKNRKNRLEDKLQDDSH